MSGRKLYGGVLLVCGEKFLLGQRNKDGSFPNYWSLFGGKIEKGESVLEGIKRELYEETKIVSDNIIFIPFEEQWDMGYECKLNDENQDWGWFDINNTPKPLFPTLFSSLTRIF